MSTEGAWITYIKYPAGFLFRGPQDIRVHTAKHRAMNYLEYEYDISNDWGEEEPGVFHATFHLNGIQYSAYYKFVPDGDEAFSSTDLN